MATWHFSKCNTTLPSKHATLPFALVNVSNLFCTGALNFTDKSKRQLSGGQTPMHVHSERTCTGLSAGTTTSSSCYGENLLHNTGHGLVMLFMLNRLNNNSRDGCMADCCMVEGMPQPGLHGRRLAPVWNPRAEGMPQPGVQGHRH